MKFELKNPFAKKQPVSEKEMDKTKKIVREAQREFESQSRRYEAEMTKLREFVAQASNLDKDSSEYKTLQRQAIGCKQKADAYEKSMKAAYSVLEKNRKFEAMLENGMTLSRLNGMLPDPESAEKLLQKISDIAQEFNEKEEELSGLFMDYSEEIESFLPEIDDSAFTEFDAMVDAQRAKNMGTEAKFVSDVHTQASAGEVPDQGTPKASDAPAPEEMSSVNEQ